MKRNIRNFHLKHQKLLPNRSGSFFVGCQGASTKSQWCSSTKQQEPALLTEGRLLSFPGKASQYMNSLSPYRTN